MQVKSGRGMIVHGVCLLALLARAAAAGATPPLGFQPNIVFILADDQDQKLSGYVDTYTELGSLEVMTTLRDVLLAGGTAFQNSYVNTPICCPSRTETFTGRYYHSIGPPGDTTGSCMHVQTSHVANRTQGLFGRLRDAGYDVGVFGKVTNDQSKILPESAEQQSMGYIDSPLDYNNYMGMTYFQKLDPDSTKTSVETLSKTKPKFGTAYQTTQIGNRTLEWLRARRASSEKHRRRHHHHGGGKSSAPFFAYVGPHAPHYPAQPAPWYETAFPNVTAPRTPNYNMSSPDKPQHIRQNPPLDARVKCWENRHFRDRWASLLSVDDLLRDVVADLDAAGELNRTVFVYSSDHGYKQGQWRVGTSKQHPYETDIRVPILFAGPGIKRGNLVRGVPVGNTDIMPTILELAGAAGVGPEMDGKSLVPHILSDAAKAALPDDAARASLRARAASWRDAWLVEYLSVGTYFNDHSNAWQDGTATTEQCGGIMPRGPDDPSPNKVLPKQQCKESDGVGDGNCWFVDSEHSNSYRALRIFGPKDGSRGDGSRDGAAAPAEDKLYVEYDPTWKFANASSLQFFELYDLAEDPYQMTNLYPSTDAATKAALHAKLSAYYGCAGADCP